MRLSQQLHTKCETSAPSLSLCYRRSSTLISSSYEGKMYRKLPNHALKPYYYWVAHDVLYVYRNKEDKEFKSLIYIGHSHEVRPLKSEF